MGVFSISSLKLNASIFFFGRLLSIRTSSGQKDRFAALQLAIHELAKGFRVLRIFPVCETWPECGGSSLRGARRQQATESSADRQSKLRTSAGAVSYLWSCVGLYHEASSPRCVGFVVRIGDGSVL